MKTINCRRSFACEGYLEILYKIILLLCSSFVVDSENNPDYITGGLGQVRQFRGHAKHTQNNPNVDRRWWKSGILRSWQILATLTNCSSRKKKERSFRLTIIKPHTRRPNKTNFSRDAGDRALGVWAAAGVRRWNPIVSIQILNDVNTFQRGRVVRVHLRVRRPAVSSWPWSETKWEQNYRLNLLLAAKGLFWYSSDLKFDSLRTFSIVRLFWFPWQASTRWPSSRSWRQPHCPCRRWSPWRSRAPARPATRFWPRTGGWSGNHPLTSHARPQSDLPLRAGANSQLPERDRCPGCPR